MIIFMPPKKNKWFNDYESVFVNEYDMWNISNKSDLFKDYRSLNDKIDDDYTITAETATNIINEVISNVRAINKKGDTYNMKTIKNIPCKIVDYKVINETVVIVTFADGTTEKAVCNKNDKFDFDRAIEICVCKKMFGGTKAYNDAVKNALRQVKAVDDKKRRESKEKEIEENRKAKVERRKAKRREQRIQQRIDIQAEAFLKAMQMYDEIAVEQNKAAFDADVERLKYMDECDNICDNDCDNCDSNEA